ncbi:MAG: trypsin-like peptidase domain-containing protein, partial [Phascolarctobacterium sp.]|nr:trypsin-like peptidase domain-containing protein [Phascolarctobacterium sp.]
HVVQGAKEITVYLTDGRNLKGKVLGTDPATDLAVVKIDADNLPEAPLGDSDTIQVGEPAIAIGNPLGMELRGSVTVGIVSALNRTVSVGDNKYTLIQTDAAINPGNSGGALVNADGEVMGINSAKYAGNGVEGIGFAIPINTAKPILQGLVEHGSIARPYLGVRIIDEESFNKKNASNKDSIGIDFHGGVYIDSMFRNSPAHKAGLRPGDIILKVNGKKVSKSTELQQAIKDSKVGDTISVTIRRGDAEMVKDVVLEAVPEEFNM